MTTDPAVALAQRFSQSRERTLLLALNGQSFTYGEAWANARRLAMAWGDEGAKPGDAIAFVLQNDVAVPCCYLACFIAGFVAVPVNPDLAADDIAFILSLVKPAFVLREAPVLEKGFDGSATFSAATIRDRVCAIFFTSGTTGRPKGVRHSLDALIGNVLSFNRAMGIGENARFYHVLPMTYMAGFLNNFLSPAMTGGTIVIGPRFSPQTALEFWRRPLVERVDSLWLTPSIAAALCRVTRDIEAARRAASGLVNVFCGTAPLNPGLRRQFLEMFGRPMQESYGTSELLLVSAQDRQQASRCLENVGRPLPELEMLSRPDDEGREELVIRSPFAILGYLTEGGGVKPAADGFTPTGDIGSIIDGDLRITGRIKDLIIRGGVNIAPKTIENAVVSLPGVGDAAAIGVPHDFWGEAIVLCVEPAPDADVRQLELDLRQHCRATLARSHYPDRIVMISEFPCTATGKLQKSQLRERLGLILGFAQIAVAAETLETASVALAHRGFAFSRIRGGVQSRPAKTTLLERSATCHDLALLSAAVPVEVLRADTGIAADPAKLDLDKDIRTIILSARDPARERTLFKSGFAAHAAARHQRMFLPRIVFERSPRRHPPP